MRHAPASRLVPALLVLAAVWGCTRPPVENRYLPLGEGRTWRYKVTPRQVMDGDELLLEVTNLKARELKGRYVTPQRVELDGRPAIQFLGVDHRGVYRWAVQAPEDAPPKFDDAAYFLVYPLEVGKSWEEDTETSLLPKPFHVKLKSRIESVGVPVSVAAGDFADCVKVHGEGATRLPVPGSYSRFDIVSVTYESWYARDVGLVKSETQELNNAASGYVSRSLRTELESYEP